MVAIAFQRRTHSDLTIQTFTGRQTCRNRLPAAHSFGLVVVTLALIPLTVAIAFQRRTHSDAKFVHPHDRIGKKSQSPSSGALIRTPLPRPNRYLPLGPPVAIAFQRRTHSDLPSCRWRCTPVMQGRNRLPAAHSFGLATPKKYAYEKPYGSQSPSSGALIRTGKCPSPIWRTPRFFRRNRLPAAHSFGQAITLITRTVRGSLLSQSPSSGAHIGRSVRRERHRLCCISSQLPSSGALIRTSGERAHSVQEGVSQSPSSGALIRTGDARERETNEQESQSPSSGALIRTVDNSAASAAQAARRNRLPAAHSFGHALSIVLLAVSALSQSPSSGALIRTKRNR